MCPFHLKGKCKKGKDCNMSHAGPAGKGGQGGGGSPGGDGKGGKKGAPPGGGAGGGKGDKGKQTPKGGGKTAEEKKKYPCYPFADGRCRHQASPEKCSFAHRELTAEEKKAKAEYLAKRATSPAPSHPSADTQVCPAWLQGDCPLGSKCKNKHPKKQKGKGVAAAGS